MPDIKPPRITTRVAAVALAVVGCTPSAAAPTPSPAATASPARTSIATVGSVPVLRDGPVEPGTYVVMPPSEGWVACPDGVTEGDCDAPSVSTTITLTIPEGWEALFEGTGLLPDTGSEPPGGMGLLYSAVRPWLHSDPCLDVQHATPDVPVGPGVDDIVNALVEHPDLDVTEPVDTDLGGYPGKSIVLTVPDEISECVTWRPWEPGIFAQGPNNIWNLWFIDVDGARFTVLAGEFPGTSDADKAELRAIVESMEFDP